MISILLFFSVALEIIYVSLPSKPRYVVLFSVGIIILFPEL